MNDDIMIAVEVYYDLARKAQSPEDREELNAAAAVMAFLGGVVLNDEMNDALVEWMESVFRRHTE